MKTTRRDFLIKGSMLAVAGLGANILPSFSRDFLQEPKEGFTLPSLPYGYDALEPHIDKLTMEIHHTKHHQAYVNNLNKAVKDEGLTGGLEELMSNVSKYSPSVRNNGGGHWNHSFFWKIMKPGGGGLPTGRLADAINGSFGSFEEFKTRFNDIAAKRFGSGWSWLMIENKKLSIGSTPNQDNPLMDVSDIKGIPVLGLDVWEHAYYLKYQNRRPEYVSAWWNLVNWEEVSHNFSKGEK